MTVKYAEKGVEKFLDKRMKLPPDLANGLASTLLKDLAPGIASTTFPMLVAAPKPRLVKLVVSRAGFATISNGRQSYRAARFQSTWTSGGSRARSRRSSGNSRKMRPFGSSAETRPVS